MKDAFDSTEEHLVIEAFAALLGEPARRQHTFPWLVGSHRRQLRIDGFFEVAQVAVEYDSRHHREYLPFFHGSLAKFEQAVARDRLKDRLLSEHGIRVIRVRDDEPRGARALAARLRLLA